MFNQALSDNNTVIIALKNSYKLANAQGEVGLANFLQDRIDTHKKHGWMLRSTDGISSLAVDGANAVSADMSGHISTTV